MYLRYVFLFFSFSLHTMDWNSRHEENRSTGEQKWWGEGFLEDLVGAFRVFAAFAAFCAFVLFAPLVAVMMVRLL